MAKRITLKGLNKELEDRNLNLRKVNAKKYELYSISSQTPKLVSTLVGTLSEVSGNIISTIEKREVSQIKSKNAGIDMKTQFKNLKIFTQLLVKGSKRLQILAGPPGIGKSFEIVESLNEFVGDNNYIVISGKSSAIEIYNTLFENNNSTIVFDDCDSIFDTDDSVNILKAASQKNHKTGRCVVSWNTNTKLIETKSFDFNGKIIVITNKDFRKSTMRKSRPLISRSFFIQFHNDRNEILERTRDIASKTQIFGLNIEERMEVVDYIASFEDFTPDLRLYEDVAEVYSKSKEFGYDWKETSASVIEASQFLDD